MVKIQPGLYMVARQRTNMYKLLAELYKEPSQDLLKGLKRERFSEMGDYNFEDFPGLKEGLEQINRKVEGEEIDVLQKELVKELKEIFKNENFPRESVQKKFGEEGEKSLTEELYGVYKKWGLDSMEDFPEEKDHLSTECGFMVHLCKNLRKKIIDREPEEVEKILLEQEKFLTNHIENWVPEFAEKIF